ncbi:hypothetical protein [Vibrio barjaei]|uniref:hypothetical protein n=1 Tax=Vibrio barjaei TaxID=1676683 RepID=UPI002284E350|nr:hypothetical protein [Vibrio barjaei]MCY9870804.1 hypothetical protein [Vibrio barjaei]
MIHTDLTSQHTSPSELSKVNDLLASAGMSTLGLSDGCRVDIHHLSLVSGRLEPDTLFIAKPKLSQKVHHVVPGYTLTRSDVDRIVAIIEEFPHEISKVWMGFESIVIESTKETTFANLKNRKLHELCSIDDYKERIDKLPVHLKLAIDFPDITTKEELARYVLKTYRNEQLYIFNYLLQC